MQRYHVLKDGQLIGSAVTRENALVLIRFEQEQEKKAHQWLHANFSIIYGEEEFIDYEQNRGART